MGHLCIILLFLPFLPWIFILFYLLDQQVRTHPKPQRSLQIRAGKEAGVRKYDGGAHGPCWGHISLPLYSIPLVLLGWTAKTLATWYAMQPP